MVAPADDWRELYRTDHLPDARMVLTSLASMDFEVRILDDRGTAVDHYHPRLTFERDAHDGRGPYLVQVQAGCVHDALEVLPDLLEEQWDFDARLDAGQVRSTRWAQVALIGSAVLIAILGAWTLHDTERN